jgi:hypothetical protein
MNSMKSSAMTVKYLSICAVGVLLCMLGVIPGARAGGPNSDQTIVDDNLSPSLDKRIQEEETPLDQSANDSALSADDLEATRAAIDRRTGSPISLSVSGWVGGEVQKGR